VVCTPASGSYFAEGFNFVTCVATDDAGNTNGCSFSIVVQDPVTEVSLTITRQGNDVVISWPQTCTSYALEGTDNLMLPITWSPVVAPVVPMGTNFTVTVSVTNGYMFFRAAAQPKFYCHYIVTAVSDFEGNPIPACGGHAIGSVICVDICPAPNQIGNCPAYTSARMKFGSRCKLTISQVGLPTFCHSCDLSRGETVENFGDYNFGFE
jgi:hypothetical protein